MGSDSDDKKGSLTLINFQTIETSFMSTLFIKPYSIAELSRMYEVNRKTLRKWLRPHEEKIGVRIGHFYTAIQVQVIFDVLGIPNRYTPIFISLLFNFSYTVDSVLV